jgi:hypothetical protein
MLWDQNWVELHPSEGWNDLARVGTLVSHGTVPHVTVSHATVSHATVSHGVAMGCQRRAPLGRMRVGTLVSHGTVPHVMVSHGVAVNRPARFTGPICARPCRTHRRCISLVSPRQRRGKPSPKGNSPVRASQMHSFPCGGACVPRHRHGLAKGCPVGAETDSVCKPQQRSARIDFAQSAKSTGMRP